MAVSDIRSKFFVFRVFAHHHVIDEPQGHSLYPCACEIPNHISALLRAQPLAKQCLSYDIHRLQIGTKKRIYLLELINRLACSMPTEVNDLKSNFSSLRFVSVWVSR